MSTSGTVALVVAGGALVTGFLIRYACNVLALMPRAARAWLRWRRPGSEPVQEALTRLIEVLRRGDTP